jgi:arginase family enzyme
MDERKKKIWKELTSKPEFFNYDADLGMTQLRIDRETPSFLNLPIAWNAKELEGADIAFVGFPWEGLRHETPSTWSLMGTPDVDPESIMHRGSADQAPAWIRQNSIRYSFHIGGGYFMETGPDFILMNEFKMFEYGDVEIKKWDIEETARRGAEKVGEIVKAGAIPLVFGGDHSTPYPIVKGISDNSDGKMGLICFDAHYDSMYGGDLPYPHHDFSRLNCGNWFYKICDECQVEPENSVFIGVKEGGAYNTPLMHKLADELGMTIFTSTDVEQMGMETVINKAIEVVTRGTDKIYVSLDADSLDPVEIPAQKAIDPFGLSTRDVLLALKIISRDTNLAGFDLVCMAPAYDIKGISALTCCKFYIEILKGLALRKIASK